MPDIVPIFRSGGAARILTDAVNAAHTRGLTVSTEADIGVVATSTHKPAWEVDQRAKTISVLGAVLLEHQPPLADVDAALSYVFGGTRPEFHEGIEEGVTGKPAPETADRLFAEGYFLGVQMRTLVWTVPCPTHLARYPRGQKCPKCAAGVPAERSASETTPRLPIETPRSVIADLIGSLTVAQVLEALADSIPGRGWESPSDAADCAIELRALAEDYRKVER